MLQQQQTNITRLIFLQLNFRTDLEMFENFIGITTYCVMQAIHYNLIQPEVLQLY